MLRHDDTTAAQPETHYRGLGVWPAVIGGLVVATAVVIFVAQNTHAMRLEFLWLDFRTSPAVLVLVTALVAVAGAIVVGAWTRRRRRRMLQQREELERLRREPPVSAVRSAPATGTSDVTGTAPAGAAAHDEEHSRPQ
jgi:uncharacterized integral membrane protein